MTGEGKDVKLLIVATAEDKMNKKALDGLKKEEEVYLELRETRLEIKDLEAELEFMESREPDEWKYIAYLKNRIDNLYKKFIKLETEHESIIELENEEIGMIMNKKFKRENPSIDDMRYDLAEQEAMNMIAADIINLLVDGYEGLDNIADIEIEEEWNKLFGESTQ